MPLDSNGYQDAPLVIPDEMKRYLLSRHDVSLTLRMAGPLGQWLAIITGPDAIAQECAPDVPTAVERTLASYIRKIHSLYLFRDLPGLYKCAHTKELRCNRHGTRRQDLLYQACTNCAGTGRVRPDHQPANAATQDPLICAICAGSGQLALCRACVLLVEISHEGVTPDSHRK